MLIFVDGAVGLGSGNDHLNRRYPRSGLVTDVRSALHHASVCGISFLFPCQTLVYSNLVTVSMLLAGYSSLQSPPIIPFSCSADYANLPVSFSHHSHSISALPLPPSVFVFVPSWTSRLTPPSRPHGQIYFPLFFATVRSLERPA